MIVTRFYVTAKNSHITVTKLFYMTSRGHIPWQLQRQFVTVRSSYKFCTCDCHWQSQLLPFVTVNGSHKPQICDYQWQSQQSHDSSHKLVTKLAIVCDYCGQSQMLKLFLKILENQFFYLQSNQFSHCIHIIIQLYSQCNPINIHHTLFASRLIH